MTLTEVYLGIGSNLGDRADNMTRGLEMLRPWARHLVASSIYETPPQGFQVQPTFYNAACRLWTWLSPFELVHMLKQIEVTVARQRVFVNGPRTLDFDVLMYGRVAFNTPVLTVPHPRMHQRAFVLAPLAEIAPGLRHPVLGLTMAELIEQLPDEAGVIKKLRLLVV